MSNREAAAASPDTRSLAQSGRSVEYINGYEAGWEAHADRAASAPQAVRMTDEQLADCVPSTATILDWVECRKVCMTRAQLHAFAAALFAAHGIVPLAPQDSTKEGGK